MGRKTRNRFVQVQIGNTNKTFKQFSVKLPFPVNIEIKPRVPKRLTVGSIVQNINASYSDRDKIIMELRKQGYDVDVQQLSIYLTDLCPQCNRRGIPKIEKKDTKDYRERTWRNKDKINKTMTRERLEYWLTYDHRSKPRKCRIKQYEGTEFNTFKPNKRKEIDFRTLTTEFVIKCNKNYE